MRLFPLDLIHQMLINQNVSACNIPRHALGRLDVYVCTDKGAPLSYPGRIPRIGLHSVCCSVTEVIILQDQRYVHVGGSTFQVMSWWVKPVITHVQNRMYSTECTAKDTFNYPTIGIVAQYYEIVMFGNTETGWPVSSIYIFRQIPSFTFSFLVGTCPLLWALWVVLK